MHKKALTLYSENHLNINKHNNIERNEKNRLKGGENTSPDFGCKNIEIIIKKKCVKDTQALCTPLDYVSFA